MCPSRILKATMFVVFLNFVGVFWWEQKTPQNQKNYKHSGLGILKRGTFRHMRTLDFYRGFDGSRNKPYKTLLVTLSQLPKQRERCIHQ